MRKRCDDLRATLPTECFPIWSQNILYKVILILRIENFNLVPKLYAI